MTCREVCEFLLDYTANELPEAARTRFEEHLRLCPPCVHYVDSYKRTVILEKAALCEDDTAPPPPEELIKAILDALRRRR
jgi:anti-sigma factor RsiW